MKKINRNQNEKKNFGNLETPITLRQMITGETFFLIEVQDNINF